MTFSGKELVRGGTPQLKAGMSLVGFESVPSLQSIPKTSSVGRHLDPSLDSDIRSGL